jgi:DNA polymerase
VVNAPVLSRRSPPLAKILATRVVRFLRARSNVPIQTAAALIPPRPTLNKLRDAAAGCRACDLWKRGTQTVFGEGTAKATILFVGEQPGDKEDLAGRPFVGPAGALFDASLEAAGIERAQVYVTNVVKHFKWEPRGKRRIHKKPNAVEIAACRPWLDSEIGVVRPRAIVCLGSTAAQAVISPRFRVTQQRGIFVPSELAEYVTATVHPSSILRAPSDEARRSERARFIEDLRRVRDALA